MKKNVGFTLIELLAVIALLGIIAVISVPVVKNTIKDAKAESLEKQTDVIMESAKNWAVQNTDLLPENSDSILVRIDTLKKEGLLENKKIINPVTNEEMNSCVEISYNSDYNQYEYDYNEACTHPKELLDVATTSEALGVNTIPSCAAYENKCNPGDAFAIKVNAEETYKFYVLSDDGKTMTLIMNKNLGDAVEWISASNYVTANQDDQTACEADVCYDEGPLTAIATLESLTNNWTKMPTLTYTYKDEIGLYDDIEKTNIMARMLTYAEAKTLGCNNQVPKTCPTWLYENLDADSSTKQKEGYWLSTKNDHHSLTAAADIHCDGTIYFHKIAGFKNSFGVRPVIELTKTPTY